MDKYEYNLRYEEIEELIRHKDFIRAVEIADTIDWTRVRSVKTLCDISDLYKINRRYKEARILLEQAYDRIPPDKPVGKNIAYSLCEICIKMEDVVGATEYYKRFVQMAPTNNKKFVLLYKIYEAQDVSLEERIQVLEELKKREPLARWWYELAYLYHRIGLTTKCVEECDELILWFREGKYVKKAMELKMLHQQLTGSQEALYKNILAPGQTDTIASAAETESIPAEELTDADNTTDSVNADAADVSYSTEPSAQTVPDTIEGDRAEAEDIIGQTELVKTVDVGQYSTINIQKALEESIKGSLSDATHEMPLDIPLGGETSDEVYDDETKIMPSKELSQMSLSEDKAASADEDKKPGGITETLIAPMLQDTGEMEELVFPEDEEDEEEPEEVKASEETVSPEVKETKEDKEDAAPSVTSDTIIYDPIEKEKLKASATAALEEINADKVSKEELMKLIDEKVAYALENAMNGQIRAKEELKNVTIPESARTAVPPRSMQKMLSQEYDGQISMVVPDQTPIEKQITGQIDIEDYLNDWENSKKERNLRQEEKIDKLVSQHTDSLLADFDLQTKDGLLEKLTEEAESEPEEEVKTEEIKEPVTEEVTEEEPVTEQEAEESVEAEAEDIAEEESETEETEESDTEEVSEDQDAEEESEEELTDEAEEETSEEEDEAEAEKEDDTEDSEETEDTEDTEELDPEEAEIEAEHIAAAEEEAESDDDGAEENTTRAMTEEESSLFGSFVQTKKGRRDLLKALDSISLASYVGNVCVTGQTGEESVDLAKNVVQYAKMTDSNFSGKIGKVSGTAINEKNMDELIEKLKGGGLIVEKAGDMTDETASKLHKALDQENLGILVVLQDSRKAINKLLNNNESLKEMFGVHIEIEELSDDALVAYGRKYAERNEFAIDDMGILALHTRIDEMQTSDHIVTVTDVRELIDEAMEHATKFSPKHFTEVLFGKRYNEDDMIILKERDFIP